MLSSLPSRAWFALAILLSAQTGRAAEANSPRSNHPALQRTFASTVHPFLETYCISCHGKEEPEADLDLTPFTSAASVVNGFSYWELVLERLEAGDMPPDKAKQHPNDAQRAAIVEWVQTLRREEAALNSGDPGPVLARRLSHAEYDYTIRDLTGVDIRPTKTFPVDPANQAGFDNSGESLAMSPALVKKYLGAAREVAEHLVLKPDGFGFAPHPVVADTDRDKWGVLRIVDFYKQQPTDLADYFAAAWRYEHRVARGQPKASFEDVAREARISTKYLVTIWAMLTAPGEDVGPIAKLQAMWRGLMPETAKTSETRLRERAVEMRDFAINLRAKIVPEVKNLTAPGIQNGSQTFVMWKNRRMAANRRSFDPAALQTDGAAPVASERPDGSEVKALISTRSTKRDPAESRVAAAGERSPANAPARPNTPATMRPAQTQTTPDIVRKGGTFLAPAIVTAGSSATVKMAAARKRGLDPDLIVPAEPAERARYEAAFERFAHAIPDAFYITERARVYLDAEKEQDNSGRLLSAGLHSMTGYFRDDGPLYDLILDGDGQRALDQLWREFEFAARIPQRMHTSFVWFERTDSSYMRDPEFDAYRPEDKSVTDQAKVLKLAEIYLAKAERSNASDPARVAIREHFRVVAESIHRVEQDRTAAEASHLQALLEFAGRAYRRPLVKEERAALERFYRNAREANGLDHEEAIRDAVVSVLMSPHFCYRIDLVEAQGPGVRHGTSAPLAAAAGSAALFNVASLEAGSTRPLSDDALASRLSYFLWSSMPDRTLLARAAAGELQRPDVLVAEAQRMLQDGRVRNFVTEFAGHWLDFRRFEEHNAVDRERFPTFDAELRQAMFEEPLRFLVDVIQQNHSVLNLLYGDYTFVNAPLARHYGMPAPAGDEWVRIDRAAEYDRGGLLPMAVFLTANSPGLRTSPVKRGYWVVRRVLGERIPPPPAAVPDLPNDEKQLGNLTLREVLAQHRADKSCASCHARFDSFGLVFEGYGPVGERRTQDFGGRPVDVRADFPGGVQGSGLPGLRDYVRQHREDDFVDQLCRKLLAYALNRTLLMSDDALIAEMKAALRAGGYRFPTLVEKVVTSPQFRMKRAPAPGVGATVSYP